MSFSYKPLWKLLIDKDMSKKQLMEVTSISKSTMDKISPKYWRNISLAHNCKHEATKPT